MLHVLFCNTYLVRKNSSLSTTRVHLVPFMLLLYYYYTCVLPSVAISTSIASALDTYKLLCRAYIDQRIININLLWISFLVFFSSSKKTTYCCRARCLSIRPSVCLSVRLSFVEITSFRGNLISNRPIDPKIGLNIC